MRVPAAWTVASPGGPVCRGPGRSDIPHGWPASDGAARSERRGGGLRRGAAGIPPPNGPQGDPAIGLGVADQGMSSITNFAVSIYIARTVGASQYGAFALAYVTYAFALSASRGLSTDPLLVRYTASDMPTWRRAVASCTGTAAVVGLVAAVCVLAVTPFLSGTTRMAFLALGLTLPALLLQDSWRFAFFALGRGSQAFLNDTVWALALFPALLLLRDTGHKDVFWFIFAWGLASAAGAIVGPFQARVIPRLSDVRSWISQHRDLGPRYLVEGSFNSGQAQVRTYAIGLVLGLALSRLRAGRQHADGPLHGHLLRDGPGHSAGGGTGASAVTAPHADLLHAGERWPGPRRTRVGRSAAGGSPKRTRALRSRQPLEADLSLILPLTISVMGGCVAAGAGTGLHALGASRRSLRAMIISSVAYVVCSLVGAVAGGAEGTMWGAAGATWISALVFWWELRVALRESSYDPAEPG